MRIIVLGSLVLLLISIFPFIYKSTSIYCKSQYGECSKSIKEDLNKIVGKPIKKVDHSISEKLSSNKEVEKFTVTYFPVSSFKVDVIEKKSEVAVKIGQNEKFYLLGSDGQVFEEAQETVLPKVFVANENLSISDPEIQFASKLLIEVYKYYSIDSFYIDESDIVGMYSKKIKLTFPTQGDIDVLLGSLELLLFQLNDRLQQSKIEDVRNFKVSEIDLRYKNPIVR